MPSPQAAEVTDELTSGRVAVGRINGVWGLRGHVKVTPLTSNPERLVEGAVLYVRGERRRILDVVTPQGYPCIRFEGYPDRTAAGALRGALIEIDEADIAPLPEGEYYVHDLEGLEVVTPEGEHVGRLKEVLTTGANDVYVIVRDTKPDALIPAIGDVVLAVDLEARRMTIEPMPGLLD
jgi:16S rRNA processing protein RimM